MRARLRISDRIPNTMHEGLITSSKAIDASQLKVINLGERVVDSPLDEFFEEAESGHRFYTDETRYVVDHNLNSVRAHTDLGQEIPCFEAAGPRRKIFFKPGETTCAIVTCGGLCPGLNDVIRSIVLQAYHRYGIRRILGIPYGFEGLNPAYGHAIIELSPAFVSNIHSFGGTALGTSRGPQDTSRMVDRLQELGVNVLFVIGGDGTQRGGLAISREALSRKYALSVVGVPKTIDNDMIFMDKSFGFESAVAAAAKTIDAAHNEARSARHGIGLVKLMGRHSGFIASFSAIASGEVNCVLIPEVPFVLEGPNGFLEFLFQRVLKRGHAVVIVAEGAGQELLDMPQATDASGNRRLGDIGVFLRGRIEDYFARRSTDLNLKYIDPSYIIRSIPAFTNDRIYCLRLGQAAVHAAMAGKTGIVVARWHGAYVHVPIPVVTSTRRLVDPTKDIWLAVLESTGQPPRFT
jgi:6-phosphofructokinase 1